jgi:hypothetical protein
MCAGKRNIAKFRTQRGRLQKAILERSFLENKP